MASRKPSLTLIALVLFVLASAAGFSACNTTKGAGEDIESVGESISDAADD